MARRARWVTYALTPTQKRGALVTTTRYAMRWEALHCAPWCVESRAVKTMREYLRQRYEVVGRVVAPLLFTGLLSLYALQLLAWWAGVAAFLLSIGTILLAYGRIRCPRCQRALGVRAQGQNSPRGRYGIGVTRYKLRDITCPHCGLTLDEPV